MPPLRVVVADDHHHVLPEIHLAIRKRALPFTGIHVLHFDAHPDLSFPRTLDPALVFEPQALYDALDDSVSGIAEFLLPLVYAGHVNRITWVKPHWAKQMPVQALPLACVGKHSTMNALCVSLPLAHFIDEDAFAPATAMDAATRKEWELVVAELPSSASAADDGGTRRTDALRDGSLLARAEALVLDIDLDYFSTWNPFRRDLEQRLGATTADTVARVFQSVQYKDMANDMAASARVCDRRAFAGAMEQLRTDSELLDRSSAAWSAMLTTVLLPLYCERPGDSANERHERETRELLGTFVDMLGALDADARELVWWAGPNMELPHHESSEDEIREMVAAFRALLARAPVSRPALVTIAKSTGDEYLPPHQLAFVQAQVLEALEGVYGDLAVDMLEYEDARDVQT